MHVVHVITFTCFYYTGIIGGKFLERGPIAKPKRSESDPTIHYQAEDLYIGSQVQFNRHKFLLIDADEYALRYMEKYSDQVLCHMTLYFLTVLVHVTAVCIKTTCTQYLQS